MGVEGNLYLSRQARDLIGVHSSVGKEEVQRVAVYEADSPGRLTEGREALEGCLEPFLEFQGAEIRRQLLR